MCRSNSFKDLPYNTDLHRGRSAYSLSLSPKSRRLRFRSRQSLHYQAYCLRSVAAAMDNYAKVHNGAAAYRRQTCAPRVENTLRDKPGHPLVAQRSARHGTTRHEKEKHEKLMPPRRNRRDVSAAVSVKGNGAAWLPRRRGGSFGYWQLSMRLILIDH